VRQRDSENYGISRKTRKVGKPGKSLCFVKNRKTHFFHVFLLFFVFLLSP